MDLPGRLRHLARAAVLFVAVSLLGAPTATAQDAQEQAATQGVADGMASSANYYSCSGLIPAYNAVTNALDIFKTVNDMGTLGEKIVKNGLGGIQKNTKAFSGRIPDYITSSAWVEVKNTKSLSFTRQLRDTLKHFQGAHLHNHYACKYQAV